MTTAQKLHSIPFLSTQDIDGTRRLEAVLAADLELPAGTTLRLVLLHGAVGAVAVVEPQRPEAAQ